MIKISIKSKWSFCVVLIMMFLFQVPLSAQTEKGIELFNAYEFSKAEQAFQDVLKTDPGNTEADYYLGLSLYMQKRYEDALVVFKGIKASKKEIPHNNGRLEIIVTRICLELKKYPEALQSLEDAKIAKADPADIHACQGGYYLETGELKKALKELEEAIKIDPDNAYAYYFAGYTYVRLGLPADGVKALKKFLELAPYAPEAEKVKILVDALC